MKSFYLSSLVSWFLRPFGGNFVTSVRSTSTSIGSKLGTHTRIPDDHAIFLCHRSNGAEGTISDRQDIL